METFARRMLYQVRRVIGIPQLEAAIREARSFPLLPPTGAQGSGNPGVDAYVKCLEDRNRTLAALSIPVIISPVSQAEVLRFCSLFAPREVEGYRKIRLGNQNDGGYIFIDDFSEISGVISCGISNDVTCDLAFADMGRRVVQFDHTVDGPPARHRNFDFRKQAIDALGTIPNSVRLWDVATAEGDRSKADLLLKIDIDGEEWATFANFPADQLQRFRQISCEFHWSSRMKDPEFFSLCRRAIENLRTSFFPVHLHANNFVGFCSLMGVPIPEVYEVTFVNSALYRPGGPQQGGPTTLDNPNNPDAPDLFLGSPFLIAQAGSSTG